MQAAVNGSDPTRAKFGPTPPDTDELDSWATAILMQEDFWHFQSMLARAIDRCTWWLPSEFLPAQATVDDRKTVFAALPDEDTNIVAAAQGRVDYLISCRNAVPGDMAPLDQATTRTLQMTFNYRENGRRALAKLARRRATAFSESHVLAQLTHCRTEKGLLARRCPDCVQRSGEAHAPQPR
jgi:hypothetical protein